MSAPFQPGDAVLCVHIDLPYRGGWLKIRRAYRVEHIELGINEFSGEEEAGLTLVGDPLNDRDPDGFWPADWFRKIDAADETFTAEMRALKPLKQGVRA